MTKIKQLLSQVLLVEMEMCGTCISWEMVGVTFPMKCPKAKFQTIWICQSQNFCH